MIKFSGNKLFVLIILFISLIFLYSLILIGFMISDKIKQEHKYEPEQIHIAIGEDISEIVISWSTRLDPKESVVKYGINCDLMKTATGSSRILDHDGVIQYVHSVTLRHLFPQIEYCYYVGSHKKWSKFYNFRSFSNDKTWSPSVAIVGDMGTKNGQALNSLINTTIKREIDAIIHIGDIGYNLFSFNGFNGDMFMKSIEPMAARVPYMVVPGNHEYVCYDPWSCPSDIGFSYETRFKMPKSKDNSRYTFSLGPALFVGINTEVYFESEIENYGLAQEQYKWLEDVLTEANLPENRARHPWIIVYGHKPVYCTANAECENGLAQEFKKGNEIQGSLLDIEDLLYLYGVDLAFWGHHHYYERSYPVYNQTAYINSMDKNPYMNPRAPVHVVTGSGGMYSGLESFNETPAPWSAFRASAYGYTKIKIFNDSHLLLGQIDVNQENHMPFPKKNKNFSPEKKVNS